jgi:hypothetical protein
MSDQLKTARNVAIILAIAAAVYFIPGGGRAANTFEAALWVAFGLGLGYLGVRLYREHRIALHSLGDRDRGLLYGAVALAVFEYMARVRMWQTGFGHDRVARARGSRGVLAAGRLSPLARLLSSSRVAHWSSSRVAHCVGAYPRSDGEPDRAAACAPGPAGRVPVQGRPRAGDLCG